MENKLNDVIEDINLSQEKDNLENIRVAYTVEGGGKGLFAKRDFKEGEVVWHLFGDTVAYATDYTIPVGKGIAVEPRLSGSVGQFMNHSCEPNIGPQNNGRDYVAMRPIQKGEELFTHYGFLGYEYGQEKEVDGSGNKVFDLTCHCGAATCKGMLGCFKDLTQEEKQKWKEYILQFLFETENKKI